MSRRVLDEVFRKDGLLAKVVARYEWREQQALMARRVMESLDDGGVLLVEAPTGVGKSLAYLVPAAVWAREHDCAVVVSSYTRTLQDQILKKDAPLLSRLVHPDLRVSVLKGRSNYICRRRWDVFCQEEGSTNEGQAVIQKLEAWVKLTDTGDLGDAPDLGRRGARLRLRISSDARFCQSAACSPQSGCFYKAARRRSREAHIVVVNHSLLLSDLALGGEVLPEAEALVIDEAHHLVRVAREHLAIQVSRRGLEKVLMDMGGLGEPGATDSLRRLVRESPSSALRAGRLKALRVVEEEVRRVYDHVGDAFGGIDLHAGRGRARRRYRGPEESPLPMEETENLISGLAGIGRRTRSLLDQLDAEGGTDREDERRQRVETALDYVAGAGSALSVLAYPDDPSRVYSVEVTDADGPLLRSVPLDVGDDLKERLFFSKQSVVMTSATLAVESSMKHMATDMGLDPTDYTEEIVPTPFEHGRQVRALGLSTGPDPNLADYDAFITDAVAAVAECVSRKMLVLFTSHELLARVGDQLQTRLPGVDVIEQTRGREGARLSRRFRASRRAVLLGTASFWEGVDFPGEDLEVLVLTRLPFAVPNDPLEEALMERIELENGRPFFERSLPQAVLRFRQGFGRLIRRRSDRGVFLVLDSRIFRARYGGVFRNSLETKMRAASSLAEICDRVQEWFAADPDAPGPGGSGSESAGPTVPDGRA